MKRQMKIGLALTGVAAAGIAYLWWRQSGISLALHGLPAGVSGVAEGKQLGQTRASCLECVEKHLGAAMVLIAETRDGWPHRLPAVGHLHEAEDESQAWPMLHDTIRAMRKDFQQNGVVPDFALLESIMTGLRG
ncbi:MAG: hypothetical protein KGK07_15980 [Chloroflexota bacterium]|nr:hypothetical protein [Chloroflexota bacterium]